MLVASWLTIYPDTDKLEVKTMEYGYVRVSTKEQNEQRQMIALQEFGIDAKRIYMTMILSQNSNMAKKAKSVL